MADDSQSTSRYDAPGARRRKPRDGARNEHKDAAPHAAPTNDALALDSELFALWSQSRRLDDSSDNLCPPGEYRDLTASNLRLAISLVRLAWRPFLSIIAEVNQLRVAMFLFTKLLHGVLPTARILDMVQTSLGGQDLDSSEVLWTSAGVMFIMAADDIFKLFSQNNDAAVRLQVNYLLERAYLRAHLSLTVHGMSDSSLSALMYEAGAFAGYETPTNAQNRQRGGYMQPFRMSSSPFDTLSSLFSIVTTSVSVLTQVALLFLALSGRTQMPSGGSRSRRGDHGKPQAAPVQSFDASSILLIVLSFLPSAIRTVGDLYGAGGGRQIRMRFRQDRTRERDVKALGQNGGHRQEIVLFGLKDWLLQLWDGQMRARMAESQAADFEVQGWSVGISVAQELVSQMFYVLLALRVLPTSLSLGSIQLYQRSARSLLQQIRTFNTNLFAVYHLVFLVSAYTIAISVPDQPHLLRAPEWRDKPLIAYDTHRPSGGGMDIRAESLSFTYPNTDRAVLHDINLHVRAGETLAIVGFNGGGKTTLVKALMGLYAHSGTLHINGLPVQVYDPATLHARTSCLFQDFARYPLTLRENVGVGDVREVDSVERIERAIRRGGAEGVLEKVGMEGWLNKSPVAEDAGHAGASEKKESGAVPRQAPGWIGLARRTAAWAGGALEVKMARSAADSTERQDRKPRGGGRGEGAESPPDSGKARENSIRGGQASAASNGGSARRDEGLSGGQWQRVALARAFMREGEADLVVFDEPSASLDPRAEAQLFERIHALSTMGGQRRTTTIYISHRFHTVRRADRIAFVENGTIVEQGTHAELIALDQRYAELYNLQKAGFEDDDA